MLPARCWGILARLILATAPSGSCSPNVTTVSAIGVPGTCRARVISYNTFLQQCHRSSWPQSDPAARRQGDQATKHLEDEFSSFEARPTSFRNAGEQTAAVTVEATKAMNDDTEATTFISFEDWKELKAREAGRDTQDLKHDPEKVPTGSHAEGWREANDIALKLEAVSEELSSIAAPPRQTSAGHANHEQQAEPVLYDDGKAQYYRSKDAGKTCKERFSYSSFDAGASVLKTNNGAKNAKAVLVENKDSYMLLECAADNKFAIVELTDDILIDTVVLANFEFFSSMIRHFRVSVSDRYPVKVDKWKDLGVFEAKNSRDIQPFLVQNPLIWAKYVRIEFLSHYGNEYYCPVSLLRVHGTRMLDSWKDTETPPDEDDTEEEHVNPGLQPLQDNDRNQGGSEHHPDGSEVAEETSSGHSTRSDIDTLEGSSPLQHPLIHRDNRDYTCPVTPVGAAETASTPQMILDTLSPHVEGHGSSVRPSVYPGDVLHAERSEQYSTGTFGRSQVSSGPAADIYVSDPPPATAMTTFTTKPTSVSHSPPENMSHISPSSPKRPSPVAQAPHRAKNSTSTSSPPSSPTVQESFHKAVSKRLQLLESNVTLSLEYLEEQSRFLQQSQQASERRQLAKVDSLLDSLNHTVLSELRHVRQQYDQIWQSTIIALENQREQSQRELVALGSRMNVLADEVVFQKRMAILQAILLLSCLVMVIFSRTVVSVPENQLNMAFASNLPRRSRLAQALHSSGLSPRHHDRRPTSIAEDDHESDTQGRDPEYDIDPIGHVPRHGHEGDLSHVRRHDVTQLGCVALDKSPVATDQDDSWLFSPSNDARHHFEMSLTTNASVAHHITRPRIAHRSSKRLLTPSSSDAQDTHSDEADAISSTEGDSRTPPSPFCRTTVAKNDTSVLRKPLPALPEHIPS